MELYTSSLYHYQNELAAKINSAISKQMVASQENNQFHYPRSLEQLLIFAVRNGDISAYANYFNATDGQIVKGGSQGILSKDPLRQVRYMFVTSAALFSRAAIDGGLDHEIACGMADVYCQEMDEYETAESIELLQAQMLLHFIDSVREAKSMHNYSKITKDACFYIERHLHEQIHIRDICGYVHISANRLTDHFKKDTGLTPIEYIHTKKLEEAAHLLRYSRYTYSDIANLLCYCNQSYFNVKFKKYYGCTPDEYRNP